VQTYRQWRDRHEHAGATSLWFFILAFIGKLGQFIYSWMVNNSPVSTQLLKYQRYQGFTTFHISHGFHKMGGFGTDLVPVWCQIDPGWMWRPPGFPWGLVQI
jgi:hypothetical protein